VAYKLLRVKEMIAMKTLRIISVVMFLVVVLTLQACVASMQLIPRSVDPTELKGTYTLMLYGCRYADDLENMAILVDETSPYQFDIYSLDSMYKVKKGLSGPQALNEANTFVRCGINPVWQTVLRKIPDGAGKTIGYELKPLYRDIAPPETLISRYSLKDGNVTAYIRLDYSLDYMGSGDGHRNSDDH
jgi:hypothetical protein